MYAGRAPALAERGVAVDAEDAEQAAVDEAGVDRQQPALEVDDADDVDAQLQDRRDAGAGDRRRSTMRCGPGSSMNTPRSSEQKPCPGDLQPRQPHRRPGDRGAAAAAAGSPRSRRAPGGRRRRHRAGTAPRRRCRRAAWPTSAGWSMPRLIPITPPMREIWKPKPSWIPGREPGGEHGEERRLAVDARAGSRARRPRPAPRCSESAPLTPSGRIASPPSPTIGPASRWARTRVRRQQADDDRRRRRRRAGRRSAAPAPRRARRADRPTRRDARPRAPARRRRDARRSRRRGRPRAHTQRAGRGARRWRSGHARQRGVELAGAPSAVSTASAGDQQRGEGRGHPGPPSVATTTSA